MYTQIMKVLYLPAHNALLSISIDGYIVQNDHIASRQALKCCDVDSKASADSAYKMGH